MITIKAFRGKKWLLIFHHKYQTTADLFKNESEVLFTNTESKFSILGSINETLKSRERYEFLLEYPGFEGFNQWTRKANPVTAEPNANIAYRPISISWKDRGFGGLARSKDVNYTFIDGSPSESTLDWFYAIGIYKNYQDSIPGFIKLAGNESESQKIKEVKLWIKVGMEERSCNIYFNYQKKLSIAFLIALAHS